MHSIQLHALQKMHYKITDLARLEVDLVLDDEGLLALGEVERPPQLGRDGRVLCLALEDEAGVAVEGVLRRRLHSPLAVVLGDRRVRAVLLGLGPVSNINHGSYNPQLAPMNMN